MGDGESDPGSADDGLPAFEITANQLASWNVARFRQAAGLRQEEVEARLGWPPKKLSALESAWKGGRPRQFDAVALLGLAAVLRVPVAAFFLPPDDDGEECRYVITGGDGDMSMGSLFTYVMPGPPEDDSKVTAYYRHRYFSAMRAYLDAEQAHEIAGTFDELATVEQAEGELDRLAEDREAARHILDRITRQEDALARRIGKMRGQ